jgi:sialidase-1
MILSRLGSIVHLSVIAVAVGMLPLAAEAAAYDATPSVNWVQPRANILAEKVLLRQPDRYIGWPDIALTDAGEMLVVFSGDRDWHVDPWGKVQMIRSGDGGVTWSEAETIIDSPLDDRDPSIAVLSDGSLYMTFSASTAFTSYPEYQEYTDSLSTSLINQWKGFWGRRSTDNGATWGAVIDNPMLTPHGPTVLDDGRLLMVGSGNGYAYESTDGGLTWGHIGTVPYNPATYNNGYAFMSETASVQASDGRIIAMSRYKDGSDIELRQTESEDGGVTWTEPHPTGMRGYPAHLLRLSNGWLLSSYGLRIPLAGEQMGQRASVSKDNGTTWLVDEEIILSNAVPQPSGDLGYPASTQLPDGSIWTVYYQTEKVEHGEYPSLMATHWRLSDNSAVTSTVFQDSFEDTTVVPGFPDAPQVGSYPVITTIDPESQVVLAGGSNPASPDASLNILTIVGKERNYGLPTEAATTGETITYDLDLNHSAGATTFGLLGDQGNDISDGQNISIWVQVTETKVQYRDGVDGSSSWVTITGLVPSLDMWEHYSIDYTVGDSTFDLTAGATTYAGLGINAITAPTLIERFILATGAATSTVSYVDNALVLFTPEAALAGDLDGDGFVGIADLNIVLGSWNQAVPPADPLADPSGDGFVGIEDLNLVLGNWNAGTPPAGVVPEPTTLGLFAVSGLMLLRRKQ